MALAMAFKTSWQTSPAAVSFNPRLQQNPKIKGV
jgi:hypothetical protein